MTHIRVGPVEGWPHRPFGIEGQARPLTGRWSAAAGDHRPFLIRACDAQAGIMSLLFAQNLSAIVVTIAAVVTLFIGLRAARPSGRR